MLRTSITPVVAALCAMGAVLSLSGCAEIADTLHHQTRATSTSRAEALRTWPTRAAAPTWLPADATRVQVVAATGGTDAAGSPAALRVAASGALPTSCHPIERRSMDPFAESWSPKGAYPDRVRRCGDWAVMPVPGGWYGWTPLTPDELRQ